MNEPERVTLFFTSFHIRRGGTKEFHHFESILDVHLFAKTDKHDHLCIPTQERGNEIYVPDILFF